MIRWFKTRRALIKELREYQTAFDALTDSFARHRTATKKTADVQQQTILQLDAALDRMRLAAGVGMARPAIRATRPAPVRGSLASRVQARHLPADLAEGEGEQ